MATNIGPKIGVEGAAEYRKQISTIIAQAKELDSEMKMVTSSFNKETTAEEKNAKKKEVLTKQIKNQQERVALLKKQVDESTKAYGENDARTIKLRTSLNNATTVLNKMGNELNDVEKEMAEAGKETAQTTDKMTRFGDATDGASNKAGGFSAGMKKVGSVLAGAVAAAAAAAATAIVAVGTAMVKASVSAASYADEIITLAATTRMSTDTLQELSYMAGLIDVDLDTIAGAMSKTITFMGKVKDGNKDAAEAINQLGIVITGAGNKMLDNEEIFWKIIDALGGIENETERDALAMTVFGKSAQELAPLLNIGSEGLKEYAQEAHDMGAVLDEDALGSLGALDDSLQRLKQSGSAAKNVIGGILAPALTNLADSATQAMAEFNKATSSGGLTAGIKSLSKSITGIVKDVAKDIPAMIQAGIGIVIALAEGIGESAPEILTAVVTVLSDPALYEGIINAAFLLINGLLEGLTEALPILLDALPGIITSIVVTLTAPENLGKMIQSAIALILALYDGIIAAIPQLIEALPQIITSLVSALTDPSTLVPLILAMPQVMASIVTGLLNAVPALIKCGADLIEELKESVLSGDFKKWGSDMIQGIIDGIRGMIKKVGDAAKDVADKIRDFLHFSRPDEGPLREYEKWMPDFMKGMAKGIRGNMWRVEDAVAGLSSDLALNVNPMADPSAAARYNNTTNVGGITVQVYGTEGQSVDALADRVMDKINITLQNSGKVWA